MWNIGRAALLAAFALSASGCTRSRELVLVDPRSGVKVTCDIPRGLGLTTIGVVREAYTCIDEMQYYGFRDAETVDGATAN